MIRGVQQNVLLKKAIKKKDKLPCRVCIKQRARRELLSPAPAFVTRLAMGCRPDGRTSFALAESHASSFTPWTGCAESP